MHLKKLIFASKNSQYHPFIIIKIFPLNENCQQGKYLVQKHFTLFMAKRSKGYLEITF